jgi:hypothetical protein
VELSIECPFGTRKPQVRGKNLALFRYNASGNGCQSPKCRPRHGIQDACLRLAWGQ